ncbi:hypothetical protein P3T43_003322 [Paraburkholderia sp. GAS41]
MYRGQERSLGGRGGGLEYVPGGGHTVVVRWCGGALVR